ncbi:hypothetical protein D3C79_952110 [compost metagenome]
MLAAAERRPALAVGQAHGQVVAGQLQQGRLAVALGLLQQAHEHLLQGLIAGCEWLGEQLRIKVDAVFGMPPTDWGAPGLGVRSGIGWRWMGQFDGQDRILLQAAGQ